jgi:uncharacterized membrane protein YphA (DoxX/SURF4 family)
MLQDVKRRLNTDQVVEFDKSSPLDEIEPSARNRAAWVKSLVAGGMLAGLALSPRLWLSSRYYPLSPVTPILASIRQPWDAVLFGGFIALLIVILVIPRCQTPVFGGALCAGALLVCVDQSRLQPWFYQYFLMLAAIRYFYSSGAEGSQCVGSINACRLIMASIYIWSGLQKINPGFANEVFPWLIGPLLNAMASRTQEFALRAWFLAPFIEVAIGVGLLNAAFRKIAVFMAVAMHCVLLLALGPLGLDTNNVVWAWNIVMVALVIVLFAGIPRLRMKEIVFPGGRRFRRFVLIAATIAPALSLFGAWDHYPSWALYSGARDEGVIYISDALFNRLPSGIQKYVYEDSADMNRLDIYRWSASELNVPVYPEVRVYLNIAKTLCRYSTEPADVSLEVTMRESLVRMGGRKSNYDCSSPAVTLK